MILADPDLSPAVVNQPDEIRRALDLLTVPDGLIEIRAPDVPSGRGKPHTVAGYFLDRDKAVQAAYVLDKRKAEGVYLVLNEANPELFARSPDQLTEYLDPTTSDKDILRRRWLYIDLDPSRPAKVSSSDKQHETARKVAEHCRDWLRHDAGWPDPVFANSGNGWHLLYRIDLPNDSESSKLVADVLAALGQEIDTAEVTVDPTAKNPARIVKMYGTHARKGFPLPDRPHRLAELIDVPDPLQVVTAEQLRAVAAGLKKQEQPGQQNNSNGNGHYESRLDVPRWLRDRGAGFKVKDRPDSEGRTIFILDRCPFNSEHGKNGETCIMQWPNGMLGASCKHHSDQDKGWRQFADAIGKPDAHHYDPPLNRKSNSEAKPAAADGKPGDPFRFHRITCAELDAATYKLEYLIDGALVAGQPCILAGGKKNLKTSIMIDLGISLAVGGCFLGKLRVKRPCRVGIMTGESGLETVQETARRIAETAGWKLKDIDGLIISEELPEFGNLAHEDALREFIATDNLEVLAVDPAYMCLPDVDHANLFQVGKQLRGVSKVCQDTGALLLLAHHTRKGGKADPYSPPELEDIAWAGFQEFCRQWLLVGRREAYQPGTGEHRLWLSVGGSAGHSDLLALDISEGTRATPGGRFWAVEVMRADEARQQVKRQREAAREQGKQERAQAALDSDRREIVGMLTKGRKETKNALRARAPFGYGRFDRAFASLAADGTLQPVEVTKGNNRAFPAWELRKAEEGT